LFDVCCVLTVHNVLYRWYNLFNANCISSVLVEEYRTHSSTYNTACTVRVKLYHTCTFNRLPEDVPSGSKPVQDIVKIKTLVKQRCILLVYIIQLYYNATCKKHKIHNYYMYIYIYIYDAACAPVLFFVHFCQFR